MGNLDLGATDTDFMGILQLILITASSKDFQMELMKFLQNSFQAFLNRKYWFYLKLLITEASTVISKLPHEFEQYNQTGEIIVK